MWGTILSAVGIGASLWGASQQADAASDAANASAASQQEVAAHNAAISRYDAYVARGEAQEAWLKTNTELAQARQQGDLFLSTQKARYGKAGVAVGTGTPLDTMARTQDEFLEDERTIAYEGMKDIMRAESLATRYDQLAEYGLRDAAAQASLTIQAGQDSSNAAWISGITQASQMTYQMGSNSGWWD